MVAGSLLLAGTGQPAPDFSYTIPGKLVVGDDVSVGGGLATVSLGASEQINNTADVDVKSDGTLALGAFTETFQNLSLGTSVGSGGVTGTGVLGLNG